MHANIHDNTQEKGKKYRRIKQNFNSIIYTAYIAKRMIFVMIFSDDLSPNMQANGKLHNKFATVPQHSIIFSKIYHAYEHTYIAYRFTYIRLINLRIPSQSFKQI